MIKKQNNLDTSDKYMGYKRHQTILRELAANDIITMQLNGTEEFRCVVLHGVKAHVNIVLQDKGEIATNKEQIQNEIAVLQAELAKLNEG
jgi:small nuclear ribonucleoprotein (snRNP)-like protein